MNAAKPALTPEQRSFLEALFKDDAAFEEDALRVYASDASLRRGPVLAMVRPRTVEQVRELMRWAEVERIPIHPRGRGTSLSGGCVPTRAGVVVSMLGMDRIFDISSEDFVAVIEPGVNTLAFQQACEQKGLFYPPDPASGKATSVGGNVMTCAGGLRAVKYGVTRDYVLGMEAVLPGGKLLKLGGRTHKDVIGLDISRMFVGSEGTLGIVTKLYLKLLPKPECAVEFMNETVLEILSRTGDVPWPDTVKSLLLFQVDGSRETVPLENARLAAQLDDALWSMQGVGKEEEDRLWAFRRRVSSSSYVLGPDRIGGDMAVPRGSLLKAVRRFEAIAASHGKRLIGFGHAGDGNIHANLHYDASDPDDARRTAAAHHALDDAALEFGGSLSGEHGGGCLKDVGKQLGADELEAMRAVRRLFDPQGILNPGKGY